MIRSLKNLDLLKFGESVKEKIIKHECADVDLLTNNLENALRETLDEMAPEKEKLCTTRSRVPWFNEIVKSYKIRLRNCEHKWRKYGEHHQWLAFDQARKDYKKVLKQEKVTTIAGRVQDCKHNPKQLFKLIKHLTGTEGENPMPDNRTDEQLAEDFADYFIGKIQKIRDNLDHFPEYEESMHQTESNIKNFKPLSEAEVRKIINSMATKSCENDCIGTKLLKEILDHVLPNIVNIINLSLKQGIFVTHWKSAIVRPLLKKAGLELISKNYRPVSNLTFLSKLLEKCALLQILDHWNENDLLPDYQSAYRSNRSLRDCLGSHGE